MAGPCFYSGKNLSVDPDAAVFKFESGYPCGSRPAANAPRCRTANGGLVGARLARECGGSGLEMFADCTGLFAGKPRSNRTTHSPNVGASLLAKGLMRCARYTTSRTISLLQGLFRSVSQTPGRTALAVFQHNPHGGDLVADSVGFSPVLRSTGRQASLDQRFDFCCINPAFGASAQEVVGFKLQHAQYAGEFLQTCRQACRCRQVGFTQTVDLAHHLEEHGAGFRGAEVVVHRCRETFDERLATGRCYRRQALERVIEAIQLRL